MEALTLKILTKEELLKVLCGLEWSKSAEYSLFNNTDDEIVSKLVASKGLCYNTKDDVIYLENIHCEDGTAVYVITITAVKEEPGIFKTWHSSARFLYIHQYK